MPNRRGEPGVGASESSAPVPGRQERLEQPEQKAQCADSAEAERKIGQHKGLVVLHYLPEYRVHRQEQKATPDVRDGRTQPEGGDMMQESPAQNSPEHGR